MEEPFFHVKRWRKDIDDSASYGKISYRLNERDLFIAQKVKFFKKIILVAPFSCFYIFGDICKELGWHDASQQRLYGGYNDWCLAFSKSVQCCYTLGGDVLIRRERGVGWNLLARVDKDFTICKKFEIVFKACNQMFIGNDTAAWGMGSDCCCKMGRTAAP
jgi:hypothetical protein